MKLFECKEYLDEINSFSKTIDLSFLDGKTILLAGACGLVMSYLIDVILADKNQNTKIIANAFSGRDKQRFAEDPRLSFVYGDVRDPAVFASIEGKIDYILNGASIVDPKGYKERPIDTMLINLLGTKNLLDLAVKNNATFLLTSSCEIYGEADVELINEEYCGRLDPMDVRSCYNESKRACETLCVSYSVEKGIRTLIARLSRTFGPTQSPRDTKALSQFMKNGIKKENIVLKSKGDQTFSFTYVQDIVSGLLILLKKGESANAYNICNNEVYKLKEIAGIVAKISGVEVIFDLSDDGMNKAGYSRITKAIQDSNKISKLGFESKVTMEDGLKRTMSVLKNYEEYKD